jgi:hypothetical protein
MLLPVLLFVGFMPGVLLLRPDAVGLYKAPCCSHLWMKTLAAAAAAKLVQVMLQHVCGQVLV